MISDTSSQSAGPPDDTPPWGDFAKYENTGQTAEPARVAYSAKDADRKYLDDPPQPNLEGRLPGIRARESQQVAGVKYFAPHLPQNGRRPQIMGISIAPNQEEATSIMATDYAEHVQKPALMKGPAGTIIKDSMDRFPLLQSEAFAYATVIPWLLPKSRRFKPKPAEVEWAKPALHELIREINPECIVAFGKVAFDALVSFKINADDARGGWFTFMDTNIPVYLMDPVTLLLTQPWTIDTLITDFKEVERFLSERAHVGPDKDPLDLREITTWEELEAQVAEWEAVDACVQSVDCEWAGVHHVDGKLRSIQFCWGWSVGTCLSFFDENNNFLLGKTLNDTGKALYMVNEWVQPGEYYIDYVRVGKILGRYLNRDHVRYLGHFCAADTPWMWVWLGLEVIGRVIFDSAFAQQTVNEYSKIGLERLAMTHTTFGRYDMPLVFWKRENKMGRDDGYGKVPREILVPYSIKDVLTVWRSRYYLEPQLESQNLLHYYRTFILPFVSNTFHTWVTVGLPVDSRLFELTRKFFNWAYRILLEDFRQLLAEQADELVAAEGSLPLPIVKALSRVRDGIPVTAADGKVVRVPNDALAVASLRGYCPQLPEPLIEHWRGIRDFNIRSAPQMRRWLFDLLKFTPIKSTSNKEKGMPAMLWDRVMELPAKQRDAMLPAVDKETVEILSLTDATGSLARLLAVSNVGNQCKGFLKEGDVDAEGEVILENGLAKFIASDGRLHGRYGLTETSRPKSNSPNVLNLSSYHNNGVVAGLLRILDEDAAIARGSAPLVIPDEFDELFGPTAERRGLKAKDLIKTRVPTIRSTIKAPEGWCIVESDYKTAEIRSQAFKFGDANLIRLMVESDPSFGLTLIGKSEHPVRLAYPEDAGILPENMRLEFIMAACEEGKPPASVTEAQLLRGPDGELRHPPYDLHWSLAELVNKKPREAMTSKKERSAGKVGNFSCSYGAVGTTVERRIEAATGIKPEPGVGDAIIAALIERQPVVSAGLDAAAECPKTGTELVAASGRKRHFPIHSSELAGMPWRVRQSYLRSMGNEARNFFPQESVAATLMRACAGLNNFYRRNDMKARVIFGLYDSAGTLCPLEERFVCVRAHTLFMDTINVWNYHDRWMSYPIETDLVYRWSWAPTAAEKIFLEDTAQCPMEPAREKMLMDKLDLIEHQFFEYQPHIKKRLNCV